MAAIERKGSEEEPLGINKVELIDLNDVLDLIDKTPLTRSQRDRLSSRLSGLPRFDSPVDPDILEDFMNSMERTLGIEETETSCLDRFSVIEDKASKLANDDDISDLVRDVVRELVGTSFDQLRAEEQNSVRRVFLDHGIIVVKDSDFGPH